MIPYFFFGQNRKILIASKRKDGSDASMKRVKEIDSPGPDKPNK